MFNLREYRQAPDRLADLLPWAMLVAPGTVLNKDGSLQRTINFRGPDFASATSSELVAFSARLNNLFKRLGSGWALYLEARRIPITDYPKNACFPDPISFLVDVEREELFKRRAENYESVYYLTFQYLLPTETTQKAIQSFFKKSALDTEKNTIDYDRQIKNFISAVDRLFDLLKDFLYEVSFLDDEETLTYLHNCISDKQHRIQVPETPAYLDGILADTPLLPGLEPKLGKHYLKTLSILGFPTASVPALLDQLNHLPLEYRWVTRFLPLDKLDAEKLLRQYKKRWFAKRKGLLTLISEMFTKGDSIMVDHSAVQKSHDAELALQELSGDYVGFGFYTATVTVWDESLAIATQKQREIERVINGLGFATINESFNAVEAWLSSLPGHAYANVRTPLMHTLNLSHLIPASASWAGHAEDQHLNAPPLFYARMRGRTPFRLALHIGDVGHQMIVGPTGSGKSVLLNLMALQFRRYANAHIFIFDKGGSFLASTFGVNGHFYNVGNAEDKQYAFQPLAKIDEPNELSWAQDWLIGLLINEQIEIVPQTKAILWEALNSLVKLPVQQRTLSSVCSLVQDKTLRAALHNYTFTGPYGDLLDAEQEKMSDNSWQYFDLEMLMQKPKIIAPVLHYLFHRLQQNFTGHPVLLILDEAWLYLEHPLFAEKIREWLKTLRKQNVAVVFATQSMADILSSSIAPTLLESCASRIFLPNPRALENQMQQSYQRLGLNDRQIEMIANATTKDQYYYQSPIGSALFELSLGKVALAFCSSGDTHKKHLLKQLHKELNYEDFLHTYLQQEELGSATTLFGLWHDYLQQRV